MSFMDIISFNPYIINPVKKKKKDYIHIPREETVKVKFKQSTLISQI